MTATYKILIVDDDPSILEVLDARLSASNFKVLKAKDAAGAEQILKAQKDIDLLRITSYNVCYTKLLRSAV